LYFGEALPLAPAALSVHAAKTLDFADSVAGGKSLGMFDLADYSESHGPPVQ
jgi:hypothetical protein